jgi:hypothetical protein
MQSQNWLPEEPPSPAPAAYPDSWVAADAAVFDERLAAEDPTLNPWLQTQWPADGARGTNDSRVSSEPDAWWRAIPAALGWMMNVLIEGFAACGEAMQPGLFGSFENDVADRDRLDETKRWNTTHDRS